MQQSKALGLLVCLIVFINIEPAIGLFDATLRGIEMIIKNDTSFMDASGLKLRRVNRSQHLISGYHDFNVDVSNDYIYVTYMFKKSGNDFKKLPYKVGPLPFCKYFDEEKFFVDTLRTKSNMPPKGTCPWPKGRYTVNNFFLNLDNIPPVFSTGEYRLNCEFYLDGVLQNGVIILLDMVSVL